MKKILENDLKDKDFKKVNEYIKKWKEKMNSKAINEFIEWNNKLQDENFDNMDYDDDDEL